MEVVIVNSNKLLYILLMVLSKHRKIKKGNEGLVIRTEELYSDKIEQEKSENLVQVIIQSDELEKKLESLEGIGRIKYKLPMIHSYVVEINKENLKNIENIDEMWKVEIDTHITAQMNRARDMINSKWAHDSNIYGEGIGVAVVDTGVSLHPDIIEGGNRVIGFQDFINGRSNPYDDNGHGTHIMGIIGGNGYSSNGLYTGIAPKCNIIGVKVLNHKGNGNISDVLAGLQWIIDNRKKYNIRIVNISVGTSNTDKADEDSLLIKGVNAVWDSGIVVVVAAGNNGPEPMSISTPGISRKVITVGAYDDDIQVQLSGSKGKDYSGRGPTNACIKKPDIVAPGSNIVSCNATKNIRMNYSPTIFGTRRSQGSNMYVTKSGTSMATPIVSGAIALLISAEPEISNKDVKIRLKKCGKDLGYPWSKQGWGLLNVKSLLEKL